METKINFLEIGNKMKKLSSLQIFNNIAELGDEEKEMAKKIATDLLEMLFLSQRYGENKEECRNAFKLLYNCWVHLRMGRSDAWHYLVSVYSESHTERNDYSQLVDGRALFIYQKNAEGKLSA